MQDASSTPAAPLRERIVARLQKELRTRRFIAGSLITLAWLVALLIVASREGHGLFDSSHTAVYEPFQLPGPDAREPLQPTMLAGTLKLQAGFGGFSGTSVRRDWFELLLPAHGNNALMPESILAIENLRLFNADGTQLCAPELRLDAPQRLLPLGIDADLALSQELAEYPTRAMPAHRFELFWTPAYSPACSYREPASVLADVVRKVAVAQEEPLWLALTDEQSFIRVGGSRIVARAGDERARGAVAASDAFFPFPDGLRVLAEAGVRAVVQPGGSVRDDEGIAAAAAAGVTMYLTGTRHFFH